MSKIIPTLLVAGFASIVILRTTHILYDYDKDFFNSNAYAENKEISSDKENLKKNDILETVNDKIVKQTGFHKEQKSDDYAISLSKPQETAKPNEICITGKLLQNALIKLNQVENREKELLKHQKLLEITDRRVREQVAKLKLMKEEIVESAKLADSSIRKESKRLISIYEKMKPKEAAIIFNEMSPNVAAELLRTMKEDQSSAILAKMEPKNAYNVTLALAQGIKQTEKNYGDVKSSMENAVKNNEEKEVQEE
jgi:flagellar motility protein MotE (MotC chaperone)